MKKILSKIKMFYNSRNKRERLMLFAFIIVGLFIWCFELSSRQNELSEKAFDLSSKITLAESVITQEPIILKALEQARKNLNSSKSIGQMQLQNFVEECAKKAGIIYDLNMPSVSNLDKMNLYSIRVNSQKANIVSLMEFEKQLLTLYPYIMLKEVNFSADGKGLINAKYTVNSFEFTNKE